MAELHVEGWDKLTPGFARHLIQLLKTDDFTTFVTAMPVEFSERLFKQLSKYGFEMFCARYENGVLIHHYVRHRKNNA